MSEKLDNILEKLKKLTLLEASDLVTLIEEAFGVDASAAAPSVMMSAMPGTGVSEAPKEEKSEFDLVLVNVPADKKIPILKVVRGITGLGLKEAKELVESTPKVLQEAMAKDAAEAAQKELEAVGAKVELK